VLRCRDLGNLPGVNGDEAWYGVQAELLLHGDPVAWRTPSGNLLNPLFFLPQLAMHAMFEPSFAVLRATAVASGLLALLVNFWLCSRVFGRRIAGISTTVLAVLPVNIAYSRLAWDASQSLLVTLPCVYLPLWAIIDGRCKLRCSVAVLPALALAAIVHPTNLFVAPIAIACLSYAWRRELLSVGRRTVGLWRKPRNRIAFVVAMTGVLAAGIFIVNSNPKLRRLWLWPAIARVANPHQYTEFMVNFGRLFSGAGSYEYLSGELTAPTSLAAGADGFRADCVPYDAAAWIVGILIAWGLLRAMRRSRPDLVCLCVGFGASLLGFFLVAGPGALAPNFERYAIWMVGPTAILASVAIGAWQLRASTTTARLSAVIAISLAWCCLLGFQANCLGFIRQTGGRAHETFRTAAVEPKQAALASILAQSEPQENVRIVTSQWWIYWPMRYLSIGRRPSDRDSRVVFELQTDASKSRMLLDPDGRRRVNVWFVEFTDSAACNAIRNTASSGGIPLRESTIDDFSGRPVLSLFEAGASNPRASQKKIKELDLTSREAELRFLSRNDDQQRSPQLNTAFAPW
jgi:hypothetical protein